MKTIEQLVQQLELFATELISSEPPINEEEIFRLETKFKLQLPNDYKAFLRVHNGFSLMGVVIYGIRNNNFDLEQCYLFEHHEVNNPMPKHLVAFSPDGTGNHYCFDLRKCNSESCEVVFWQHDSFYDDEHEPEVVNSSFAEWVQEVVIAWTLEDYDYNGNKK